MNKTSNSFHNHSQSSYYRDLDFESVISNSNSHEGRNSINEHRIPNFSFHKKVTSDSIKELNVERSKSFIANKKNEPIIDYWKIKPPDFSFIQFEPKKISVREKAKQKQEKVREDLSKEQKRVLKSAPALSLHAKEYVEQFQRTIQKPALKIPDFQYKFHLLQPQEDRILSLKSLKDNEPYKNPKEHDFRQYIPLSVLGLPEFKTVKELDKTIFQRELLKLKCNYNK